MTRPKALIIGGLGINCERDTAFAFNRAGAEAEIVHVNDLIDRRRKLEDYQILAFPGGFSYGDDTGAGNAFANRIRSRLLDDMLGFLADEKLVIGICNGFQILANLGLLPALHKEYGERNVALVHNDSARYNCRWVDLEFSGKSPWVNGIDMISLPIAHGEGKFYASPEVLAQLNSMGLVAARYAEGEMCRYSGLDANPNGSLDNIAAITDFSGRVLGIMPHPERAIDFTHRPDWTLLRERYKRAGAEIPEEGPGLQIFRKGVRYFS